MKKTMRNDDNDYWRYILKREFTDVKMMNIHQKTIAFFWKSDENIPWSGHFIDKKLWKHTKIQLSNEWGGWEGWGRGKREGGEVMDILTVFIVLWDGDLSMQKTMKCRNFYDHAKISLNGH